MAETHEHQHEHADTERNGLQGNGMRTASHLLLEDPEGLVLAGVVAGELALARDVDDHVVGVHAQERLHVSAVQRVGPLAQQLLVRVRH